MDELIIVLDRFMHPTRGLVVSGVNAALDALADNEIRKLVGKRVTIRSRNGTERAAAVEAVDIARSLLGKVNIHLSFGPSLKESEVELGAAVLTTSPSR